MRVLAGLLLLFTMADDGSGRSSLVPWLLVGVVVFDADRYRPREAEELAADGGDDLGVGFPLSLQCGIAPVQPVLSLPADLVEVGRELALAGTERLSLARAVAIRPGGLDEDAA